MFSDLTPQEIESYAPELIGQPGVKIVKFQDKYWYIKHIENRPAEHKKADSLGWLLGKNILNIAEVKSLNHDEVDELSKHVHFQSSNKITSENTYLVRLANSYSFDELLLKTNDEAIAFELAFSLWIRRRDAHQLNRVYINGVPIFFDHHVAFLVDSQFMYSDFFHEPPSDYGQASAWRVVIRNNEIKTEDGRNNPIFWSSIFIHNVGNFKINLQLAVEKIINIPDEVLKEAANSAGYIADERDQKLQFLKESQLQLKHDSGYMEEIIFKPFEVWKYINEK